MKNQQIFPISDLVVYGNLKFYLEQRWENLTLKKISLFYSVFISIFKYRILQIMENLY